MLMLLYVPNIGEYKHTHNAIKMPKVNIKARK